MISNHSIFTVSARLSLTHLAWALKVSRTAERLGYLFFFIEWLINAIRNSLVSMNLRLCSSVDYRGTMVTANDGFSNRILVICNHVIGLRSDLKGGRELHNSDHDELFDSVAN